MLKPLYHYFENDFIDFWSILNVEFGAKPSTIHNRYFHHLRKNNFEEKIDEHYVAYKLLRDKNFEKVYKDTKSLEKTYDAGFFLDSMDIHDLYCFSDINHMPVIPMDRISFDEEKTNIVLISTGGFSPVHEGHLHTLKIAKKVMEEKGYHVAGGYLSPSHDHYVSTKDNGKAHNHALNRVRLCNEAVIDSDWIMTSPYESVYTKTSVNYTDALSAIEEQIKRTFKKDIVIGYVFGGDNAPFIRAFQDKDIAICISRNHEREKIFKEDNIEHLNYVYIEENPFTDVSSTKIRRSNEINRDPSKNEMSDIYLIRDDFHFYNKIPKEYSPISELKTAFSKALPDFNFVSIDVNKQIKKAKRKLQNNSKKTLSLDVYLKGDYNLELSRVFNVSDSQIKAKAFTKRPESKDTLLSTNDLKKHSEYILIEDDVASGQTLSYVESLLPKNSYLIDQVLLSQFSDEQTNEHFDIVDLRDFIINAPFGGLVVNHKHKTFRVPYISPFVDLISRANIPAEKVIEFSIDILNMNIDFYEKLKLNGIEIELNEQTIALFEHVNFRGYKKLNPINAIQSYCMRQILFLTEGS